MSTGVGFSNCTDDSSDDDDFNYESSVGSRKYPVHDCCEFDDHECLKRLIFVRQDDSDDDLSSASSSSSNDDASSSSSDDGNNSALMLRDKEKKLTPGSDKSDDKEKLSKVTIKTEVEIKNTHTSKIDEKDSVHDRGKNNGERIGGNDSKSCGNEAAAGADKNPQNEQHHITDDKKEENMPEDKIGEDKPKIDRSPGGGHTQKFPEDVNGSRNDIFATVKKESGDDQENKGKEINGNLAPKETTVVAPSNNDREEILSKSDGFDDGNLKVKQNSTISASASDGKIRQPDEKLVGFPKEDQQRRDGVKKKKSKKKHIRQVTYYCPYDLNQRDEDENTPLHIAIHARKLECARLLLEAGAGVHKRSDGSAPIHLAISLGAIAEHEEFAEKCLSLLASHGADFSMKDESFHTPLYLACMSNVPRCAQIILSDPNGLSTLNMRADRTGGRPLHACAKYCKSPHRSRLGSAAHAHRRASAARNSSRQDSQDDDDALITGVLLAIPGIEVNAVNNYGQTPLHLAASKGNWATARLLLQAGANPLSKDRRNLTAGQLASKRGIVIPNDLERLLATGTNSGLQPSNTCNSRDLIIDPDASTMLLCHGLCSRHMSCPPIRRGGGAAADPPPENVRRLHVLLNEKVGILRCEEFLGCSWETQARRAAMGDVLRVHDYQYIERISQLCASIPDHPSAIASLDPDTAVSHWSFEAALRAAGAVCEAVDKVMAGDHRNAFCAVRPPGHHAGPRGIVTCPNDPEGSHGFCLLNNVAIGAAYARSMYRNDGIRKVAIIDFDVHHGNGTEEIVRQLVPQIQSAPVRTPFAIGTLQTPTYKPWLDEEDINEVFFSSTHGYGPRENNNFSGQNQPSQGGWFYPASGATAASDAVNNPSSNQRTSLADFISSQTWTRMGEEARFNCCKIIDVGLGLPRHNDIPGMQRVHVRDAYRKNILPHLVDFDPDMIFISAGFDAHKRDGMNFGYLGMIEDDYEWLTEQLVKVANSCCQGRIVSVLEGGYKIHGGIVSPFARSVASHVRALVDGGSSREMYRKEDSTWESQFERELCEEKERRRQGKIDRFRTGAETDRRYNTRQANSSTSNTSYQPVNVNDIGHLPAAGAERNDQDMDGILNEPLNDVPASAASALISAGLGASPQIHGNITPLHVDHSEEAPARSDDSLPSRKRRRGHVDYKELFEIMKKEGSLAG